MLSETKDRAEFLFTFTKVHNRLYHMCGILSIINLKNNINGINLIKASSVIRHRGPDDEGFLTWLPGEEPQVWAGNDTAASTRDHWKYNELRPDQPFKVGLGHRRLSILDLSPTGHQPMIYPKAGLAVVFNGEIYNYLEIKEELIKLGHTFTSKSDTEVILHAWEEWGADCLQDFNGMFAIVLLDYHENKLYAVRDRFGVKPVYYYNGANSLYIASEIKQIRTAPGYKFNMSEPVARQFLATGVTDNTEHTFDTEVKQLPGGHYLTIDLTADAAKYVITKWYTLSPRKWTGSYDAAAERLKELLTDAVRLRLRSDVKVGSCLSGGLDSSSIVCIAAELLKAKGDFAGQETVTACFDIARYDEWGFAQEVIKKTNAHAHRTFPSFTQLKNELGAFFRHQDEPVASTSVFSQWAVFKATHEAGLKVMIDGQGADEQLAGYGGNDLPFYSGLLQKAHLFSLLGEVRAYKKEKGYWPTGFVLGALQLNAGNFFKGLLPEKLRVKDAPAVEWLRGNEPVTIHSNVARNLKENLLRQVYGAPLPGLLRFEDRNSMAWSVESRTPFMDYRLLEFTLGLPARYVYNNGVRKSVLRKAMHGTIPTDIENRKDKMGFVTPEEVWLKGEGKEWFLDAIDDTCNMFKHMIDEGLLKKHVQDIIEGREAFSFLPWRVAALGIWYRGVNEA